MNVDKREVARKLVLSHTKDIEYSSVGDHFWLDEDFGKLTPDEQDQLCQEIHDLMGQATVTVTLPGDDEATSVARILRRHADRIDAGPPVPLPPSVYSTLLREYADDLDSESDGTPADFPQWENLRELIQAWIQTDNDETVEELADKVMVLFGADPEARTPGRDQATSTGGQTGGRQE